MRFVPLLALLGGCLIYPRQIVGQGPYVGQDHRPYRGRPNYFVAGATLPMMRPGGSNPVHITRTPAAAEPQEESKEDQEGQAEKEEAPRERPIGGTFTVSPPNPAAQPNRETSQPQPWQPIIIVP